MDKKWRNSIFQLLPLDGRYFLTVALKIKIHLFMANRSACMAKVGPVLKWSALVNIRRKVLLSLVGFRKCMTSRSPRLDVFNILKYVIYLRFDRLYRTCLIFGESWFCPTFSTIPRLIPINSNKKMPLHPFKGCFDVSSLFFNTLRGKGPFSGCY